MELLKIKKFLVIKRQKCLWYYEQASLGFNYRMNDIEAALGISQLKKLENSFLEKVFDITVDT